MKCKILIALLLSFVIISCNNEKKIEYDGEQISVGIDKDRYFNLSEVIDSISYVRLETNENCLVGRIDKIMQHDSLLFISDRESSNAIFCFTMNGEFVFKIDRSGKGPGEYLRIDDCCIDSDGNILLYDAGLKKIIKCDNNGNFTGDEIELDFYADYFAYLSPQDNYVFYSSYREAFNRCNLIITNSEGKVISKYLQFDKKYNTNKATMPFQNLRSYNTNSVPVFQMYDNKVYEINNEGFICKYEFDFGRYTLPLDYLVGNNREQQFDEKYCFLIDSWGTKSSVVYLVGHDSRVGLGFYNKENKNNIFGIRQYKNKQEIPFINDIDKMGFYNFVGNSEKCLFSCYEISEVLKNEEVLKRLGNNANYDISDNPIIAVYHVK